MHSHLDHACNLSAPWLDCNSGPNYKPESAFFLGGGGEEVPSMLIDFAQPFLAPGDGDGEVTEGC